MIHDDVTIMIFTIEIRKALPLLTMNHLWWVIVCLLSRFLLLMGLTFPKENNPIIDADSA